MTDKTKHKNVFFTTRSRIPSVVSDPLFCDIEEVDSDLFEITADKKTILFNEPNIIGFDVYCHAKLRMLQFLYDFLDKYVDRADYQLMQMDTGNT